MADKIEQLTPDQAVEFAKSGVWEEWTHEQIVRFQLFQDKLCMPFSRFHEAIESVLGRPVYTHEFAFNPDGIMQEYLGTRQAPTFEEIVAMIPESKRVILTH